VKGVVVVFGGFDLDVFVVGFDYLVVDGQFDVGVFCFVVEL